MYQRYQKPLATFGAVGLIFLGAGVIKGASSDSALIAASKSNRETIPEINLEIDRHWQKGEVVFESEEAKNLGKIIWIKSVNSESIAPCYLGVYYLIEKKSIPTLQRAGVEVSQVLNSALQSSNYLNTRAKEFPSSFLVYEPNRKACAGGIFSQKKEMALRESIWQTVDTASITSR